MKNTVLKEGLVIEHDGMSWVVNEVYYSELYEEFHIGIDRICCDKCNGNLEKFGSRKGQYKCLVCSKPVYID
jgi:hypothetical protein